MNQILVTDKLYVTQKLRKKKMRYRIEFVISLICVFIFSGWYIYSEVEKNACEAVSQDILNEISIGDIANDVTTAENDALIVAFDDDTEIIDNEVQTPVDNGTYTDNNGTTYTYESILSIPTLKIEYPVLSETSEDLLKISLNKFWGGSPNTVGNYCIVGHNYKSGKMFGKLSQIKTGDKVYLKDMSGKTLAYQVYDKFIVYPDNVACTSQITNGLKEMTLITCTNAGKQRLIVKCREV